jgi:putative transposase
VPPSPHRQGWFFIVRLIPWGLKRYQNTGEVHFITFSCYRRLPLLEAYRAYDLFEWALEQSRLNYGFEVIGYVLMPEHVHLLMSETDHASVATALRAMKQSVARRLAGRGDHFWQQRYYDFNVRTEKKRIEKLRYMHRNPVKRGWWRNPRTGSEAAFGTTPQARKVSSRSNHRGPPASAKEWESPSRT